MTRSWIQTFTGRRINPLYPDPALIDPTDIAVSLSRQARFTGHTKLFYSVAQHSALVMLLAKIEELTLAEQAVALLHDAAEAYLVDIPRPLKRTAVFDEYRKVEERLERAIAERFGLTWPWPTTIKELDNRVGAHESRLLMNADEGWGEWVNGQEPLPSLNSFDHIGTHEALPREAAAMFIHGFNYLKGEGALNG